MDFSVITIGQVQNVLSAMQKNLECPICLDVVQEPVSTKCDHIFCRFCMFKLISKKKKGVVECPLCKTEVTKRSLKENSKFKQLIEGLLEIIHAFELDTGVKFLKSHHFPQTSTEATATESLCKESSVIQSKGFRNRRKSAKGNEQENITLQEASVNIQLTDAKMCHPRYKPQKSDSQKGTYIEFGSESSEEFFNQATKTGFEDKGAVQVSPQVRLEELQSAEKGNENSCNAQPDKLCAKEIMLPDVTGESDFSKECLSKKSTQSTTECAKPDQVNVTECQSSPLNVLTVDLLPEQWDTIGDASPTVDGDTPFFKNTEEMDEQQTQYDSENREFDLEGISVGRLDKSKGVDTHVQNVEAVEACEPENDSFHDQELPLEQVPQPETLDSATPNKVSKKRLKQSIQKVNEWFSKSNEILSSNSSLDESAASADISDEGDLCLSDKESSISEKTDPMADSMEVAAVEGKKGQSKQTAESIKDKIFGRTYKRGRKSNPPSTLRTILPTRRKEDVAADKCLKNFSRDRLKRKSACVLQPEDFIKKKDTEEADGGPQGDDRGLGDAGKKRCDGSVAVNESHLSQNRANNTLTELGEGGESTLKKATEKVPAKSCDGDPEMHNCDQKSTKKRGSAAKRCRHSSRTMCSLQLVVDRDSVFPDAAEPQIDSYPSSGEPRKADSEQNPVRRSRRLQLLSEEMKKEGKKEVEGARENNSDHGRSVSGDQRSGAAHSAECKDLCEPQDESSYRPVTNLEGGDLEANEMQVALKNLPGTAETGRSLFNPSRLPSNCGSTVPGTSSQGSEILGSPLLLQLPSVSAGQTASQKTEEVSESPAACPQECGHDPQSVPGDLKTEKLPMAKNVLELSKEAEDSDLDTQYLRNIFRHSKRLSFSLFQTPRQARAGGDPPSETLTLSCAAQVENKATKHLQPESLQEEKTAAQNLSRVSEKEKFKACESAHVDPVPCSAVSTGEHRDDISQAAEEGTLTPARASTAQTEHKNGLLQEEQDNEKPEIGIESELRQNLIKSGGSQSDQSNTEHDDSRQNYLNSGQEISFSSESNQAGKTEVVDYKGPILHFQSTSMICPATCEQSPAEFSCEVTGTKSSKRERKSVKVNEEQAAQSVSTAMPKCSAAEALEEPLRENHDLRGLSETPDDLLCSDADIEDSSLCETDRKEQSAVFVKCDNALGKELYNRNASSEPRSQDIQKSRRRVQKLPSSDEESCEDEDLPCFQALLFSKSVSTPLQNDKQMASLVECAVSPSMFPHSVGNDDNIVQNVPEAALSNVCVSPSQGSECSVNLFSSQSNMSEESPNGAQELKKDLPQAHESKQMNSVSDSKETSQSCNEGLKTSKDECQEDPDMGANLGEAGSGSGSGSDSEISIVEDSCGPFSQGEILTTQQKNAMQNSLKKLQQEMAALEAVLKQNGSENCEVLPVHRELPPSSTEGAFEKEQTRKEKNRSPELLLPSSKSSLTKRSDVEKGSECDSVLKNKTPSEKTKPVQGAVQEHRQCQLGAENAEEQKSGTRQNTASVSSDLFGNVTQSSDNSSSSLELFVPQTAEATGGPVVAQNTDKSCGPGHKLKRSGCFPVPVLHNEIGKENAASPVVTKRKEMSIVASGLNHSEHLVVQKFVKKTQSTLSNHITEGTTHVIMKTDKELVCERTLKYFLGIAGGKWVVSYQWIIQSFKEGRILDEEPFEVRGDVINGRNHQGPKRARQALTEKIFKDFEICCCGPFTDMTTEHLEWMVELCGASVVKQPDLFSHTANSTAVVVVQPDAWKENVDYRAIPQQSSVAVVTREWVLDSVAGYECQEISAYLLS